MNHFDPEKIGEPYHWEYFGGVEIIKQWTVEIKEALIRQAGLDDWLLIGRAVTLICDDPVKARAIVSQVARDARLSFKAISPSELVDNGVETCHSSVPCLIYLEPGDWMRLDSKQQDNQDDVLINVKAAIKNAIHAFDCCNPVIFTTSIQDFADFDVGFKQQGLFDRRFSIPAPSHQTIGNDFLALVGQDKCNLSLVQECKKVGYIVSSEFNDLRRQGVLALAMKRLAFREKRLLEFADLIRFVVNGTMEADVDDEKLKMDTKVVVHEAGHASVAIIDSHAENIPDYVSVIGSSYASGITAESYAYNMHHVHQLTYRLIRHKVRVCLAGRAAEQIIFGSEYVSVYGAMTDMHDANALCSKMFGDSGISTDMEDEGASGNNLIVRRHEASHLDEAKVIEQIQYYLKKQYAIVLNLLKDNRPLLDKIIEQLNVRHVLLQSDLNTIHKNVIVQYSDT